MMLTSLAASFLSRQSNHQPSVCAAALISARFLQHASADLYSSCTSPIVSTGVSNNVQAALPRAPPLLHLQQCCDGSAPSWSCFSRKLSFTGLPWLQRSHPIAQACSLSQHIRSILCAPAPQRKNPPGPNHSKHKVVHPQPTYDWARGRFIIDRNKAIWHRTAGYEHKRHSKTAAHLTRLKRWKPLAKAYARKMYKLGFRTKYWAPPDPHDVQRGAQGAGGVDPRGSHSHHQVPGFHAVKGGRPQAKRWNAKPDLRPLKGDPALRPH